MFNLCIGFLLLATLSLACHEYRPPRDCFEHQICQYKGSPPMNEEPGVFLASIAPSGVPALDAPCDDSHGGYWTVIQVRDSAVKPRENFNRTWLEYQLGFGDYSGEFWLGLENIHALTKRVLMELRIELTDDKGTGMKYANYKYFFVGDAGDNYRLYLGEYSGDAGDSLNLHNLESFSTFDQDNGVHTENCAEKYSGGWWFNEGCYSSNLNGNAHVGDYATDGDGIVWYILGDFQHSMKKTRMMIRPAHRRNFK